MSPAGQPPRVAFTLDQLNGFIAVAEEGNFGRAAERLMMTQPPLSRQIQKLERSLGVILFHRTARGTELTAAGKVFLVEARRLLTQANGAALAARRVSEGSRGTIRLGVTVAGALDVLGNWVRLVQSQLPGVDLVLKEMVTTAQVRALLAGELDVGLVRGRFLPEPVETRLVHTQNLMLAAPDGHPLTRRSAVSLADISAHSLLTYDPGQARYFYELIVTIFRGGGHTPRYVQQVSQVTTILALVAAGVGVALVPESMSSVQVSGVTYRSVTDIPEGAVELHMAWRSDNDNPAVAALLRAVTAAR